MPTDINKIVDGFPHPIIPPIIGVPTYQSISELNLQLNANAASVQSNLGDGQQGLLALTVSTAIYATISNIPFVAPANPGPTADLPEGGGTGPVLAAIVAAHKLATDIFKEYNATDKALKQQVISAVNNIYISTLRHRITGFANVSTREMLVHLYTTYGRLTAANIQANDERMKSQYDPNQPLETFIAQIEDSVALADAAATPYSTPQILSIAYNNIFSTGMFSDACRDWRRKTAADKTWATFKSDFALAHQELQESKITSDQAGYHSANSAFDIQKETANAIANLATATAADCSTVTSLTSTNSTLSNDLATANIKLTAAVTELTQLKLEMATMKSSQSRRPTNDRRSTTYIPNGNYCWSHGYKVNIDHTSASCTRRLPGHQTTATKTNDMGGSQKGKD